LAGRHRTPRRALGPGNLLRHRPRPAGRRSHESEGLAEAMHVAARARHLGSYLDETRRNGAGTPTTGD